MLHVYAVLAEKKRRMVAECTRAALGVRKAQGAQLGNRTNLAAAQRLGAARTAEAARRFAENTAPVVSEIQASGVASLRGVAAVLNMRGVRTVRGSDGPRPSRRGAPPSRARGDVGQAAGVGR